MFKYAAMTLGAMCVLAMGVVASSMAQDSPPGQGECGHGNSGKECKPDPQPEHGKDCEEHGNKGGVNEDHCKAADPTTPDPTTPTVTTPTTPTVTTPTTTTPMDTGVTTVVGSTPPVVTVTTPSSPTSTVTGTSSASKTVVATKAQPKLRKFNIKKEVRRSAKAVVLKCAANSRAFKGTCYPIVRGNG